MGRGSALMIHSVSRAPNTRPETNRVQYCTWWLSQIAWKFNLTALREEMRVILKDRGRKFQFFLVI